MYIVIDTFDSLFPTIVCNEDGYPIIFDSKEEAEEEASECQEAIVVEI